jgi:TolB protein
MRRLTKTQATDGSPAWSPDGGWIAFVSDRSDRDRHENEIYVMRADGSGLRRLTRNDVWDLEPVWRP